MIEKKIKKEEENIKNTIEDTVSKEINKYDEPFAHITNWQVEGFRYRIIFEGVGVGIFVGIIISMYRYSMEKVTSLQQLCIKIGQGNALHFIIGLAIILFLLCVGGFIVNRISLAGASGIPQVEAELKEGVDANWWQVLIGKFTGSIISIGAGLSLGTEGPSIQIGAMVGKGFSRISKRMKTEERLLLTCGASAGLAAGFGAPLAGVIFALEELHKNFSKEVLLSTMASTITADCIASYAFGLDPIFTFEVSSGMPIDRIWMVGGLGIILGICGVFYNKSTTVVQAIFKRIPNPIKHIVIPLVMVGILWLFIPDALGSGEILIEPLGNGNYTIKTLLILLIVKYISSTISMGTGLAGGTFMPMLVLGTLTGCLYAEYFSPALGYSDSCVEYFAILGMAGYFAATTKSPITGIVLITEMTGTFSNLLQLSAVSLIAYVTSDWLKGGALYADETDRLLQGGYISRKSGTVVDKVMFETDVYVGCMMEQQPLSSLKLPQDCSVLAISRDGNRLTPDDKTVVEAGDKILLVCQENRVVEAEAMMQKQCREVYDT